MKSLMPVLLVAFFLGSCVFEAPFEPIAKLPVDDRLTGRWEELDPKGKPAADRMLVLRHSDHEYLVQYPVGDKAMFFRAFAIEVEDVRGIQIQLIGTAEGAVKPEDRKYHLVKVLVKEHEMEVQTIHPEVLGKVRQDTDSLRTALIAHKNDADLFDEPMKFRRVD